MPLIDGMGDEVVHFGIAVVVVVVATLAWLSTNARPDRYRAVIQMHARGHHAVTVSIRPGQGVRDIRTQSSVAQAPAIDPSDMRQPVINASNQTENNVIPLQEMDSIVDADMAMMNNNRLHFYRRIEGPATVTNAEESESTSDASETAEELEPASNAQIREMDSIVSAMEADLTDSNVTNNVAEINDGSTTLQNNDDETEVNLSKEKIEVTKEDLSEPDPDTADALKPEASDRRKILIKLKYINDTLKEVEGSLDEQLKDFKCRHFSAELSSESRVRLIFNGRVLLDEGATLRACGLHHRAVVHCLVQPGRAANTQPPATPERTGHVHEMVTEIIHPERYWDLENILMTLVSLALTIVWFFRYEYSNMFTASASVALFGLTVFYSVAIFGLYFSDAFYFERRPPQPTPTN